MMMIRLLIFAAILFCTHSLFAESTDELLPIKVKGKYGYINLKGKIVIEPRYSWLGEFSEGLAAAKLDSLFGYIDSTGKLVIPYKYDEAKDFKEGFAVVTVGGKSNYIDHSGKIPFATNYSSIGSFTNGLARVAGFNDHDQKKYIGVINKRGILIVDTIYTTIEKFYDGVAYAISPRNTGMKGNLHQIDTSGNILFSYFSRELTVEKFKDGYALAYQNTGKIDSQIIGIIRKNGSFKRIGLTSDTFDLSGREFIDGYCRVYFNPYKTTHINHYALMDTNGTILLDDPKNKSILQNYKGQVFVSRSNGDLFLYDIAKASLKKLPFQTSGAITFQYLFKDIFLFRSFKNRRDKEGIINSTGTVLMPAIYDAIHKTSNPRYLEWTCRTSADGSLLKRDKYGIFDIKKGKQISRFKGYRKSTKYAIECLKNDTYDWYTYDGKLIWKNEKEKEED